MKMRFSEYNDLDSDIFYIGYYEDQPYAVAQEKKLIKNYMENHRMLDPEDYLIMEEEMDNYDLCEYRDLVIYEAYGFYLPDRDISIASISMQQMDVELEHAFFSLKNLSNLIGQLKNQEDARDKLIAAANAISKIAENEKNISKLNKYSFAEAPVVYCTMKDYHRILIDYEEKQERFNAWYY